MKMALVALSIIAGLTGCATAPSAELELSANELRPAIVFRYQYPLQSATNNVESLKAALAQSKAGDLAPEDRQVIVVANIGEGGEAIAMERAKKGALLAIKAGEVQPRLYVRKSLQAWQRDKLEFFSVPKKQWDDKAFLYTMTSESLVVQPLGGILKAEIARRSLDQVLERRIDVPAGNLSVALSNALKSVGWTLEGYKLPASEISNVTIAVSLGESGQATAHEATVLARTIINLTSTPNLDIRTDVRRQIVEVYGESI